MSAADKVKVDNAILRTTQTLTDDQKAQARANIGAVQTWEELSGKPLSVDSLVWNGMPGDLYSVSIMFFGSIPATLYKVSDLTPSYESFLRGFSIATLDVRNGKIQVTAVSADKAADMMSQAEDGSGLAIALGQIIVCYTEYTDTSGNVMKPGIYFMELENGGVRSIQINGYSGFSSEQFDDSVIPYTVSRVGHTHKDLAPAYDYDTADLTAGTSKLETGKLYFVYE